MQTYSHLLIGGFLNRRLKALDLKAIPPLRSGALLFGSVLPDVPLTGVAVAAIFADIFGVSRADGSAWTSWLFDTAFFHENWVKAIHNLFHAPILVLTYLGIGLLLYKLKQTIGPAIFWLAMGCLIHTAIDIPLHYNDGPLLLFPINWEFRFYSPVSYWDPAHFGIPASIAEHLMVVGLLIMWWRARKKVS